MVHVATNPSFFFFLLLLFLLLPSFLAAAHGRNGASVFSRRVHVHAKKLEERMTHLHFYFHDVVVGRNATAVRVIPSAVPASPGFFGMLTVMDDLLTEGPEPTSRPVGRAQGFYACAALEELGLLQAMNLVFTDERYNGSVVTVLGRNAPLREVREMPVVGGSGLFRFARGYAVARTHSFDASAAVVEYDVYVMHYANPMNM